MNHHVKRYGAKEMTLDQTEALIVYGKFLSEDQPGTIHRRWKYSLKRRLRRESKPS